MKNIQLFFILCFLFLVNAQASELQVIDTLGVSSKGQFIALEEYGYKASGHTYYVKIKVMNVWKKEYVGKNYEVEVPAHQPSFLKNAREKAKIFVRDDLKKYGISV